ncbi:MAG: flagellar hook-basal body protein [Desulfobacteraceae bacterium]|nr:MAG: flagellar hook-basal body protein [Desulfobacteraceae bacterium]
MLSEMTDAVQAALRQEVQLNIIANHLANVNTIGFKADVLSFDEMLQANMTTDHAPGPSIRTENALDLAIDEEGFFKIQTPRGIRYTRNGTFTLNSDNVLVTQNGDPVMSDQGSILIEGDNVKVGEAGEIWVQNPATRDFEMAGQLAVVTFAAKEKLTKEGDSLFVYNGSEDEETVSSNFRVKQGELEASNIETVIEMTKMVETMRNYESCMKVIQSLDETDAKAINEVGKV